MKPQAATKALAQDEAIKKSGPSVRQPLYRQVAHTLKNEIISGVYPVGTQIPTEEELTVRFDVSRHTVRQALRQLRDDGLVASRQRVGTTVLPIGTGDSYVHEVSSINDIITFATEIRYQVDSSEMIVSDAETVRRIGGSVGQRWLRIRGFRYAEKQLKPVCWTEVFLDAEYAGLSRLIGHRPGTVFELIEDLYGERIAEVEQVLNGRVVPAEIAPQFEIEAGENVIQIQRTYRLSSGKVAEIAFSLYPIDQFRFAMTLRRVKS